MSNKLKKIVLCFAILSITAPFAHNLSAMRSFHRKNDNTFTGHLAAAPEHVVELDSQRSFTTVPLPTTQPLGKFEERVAAPKRQTKQQQTLEEQGFANAALQTLAPAAWYAYRITGEVAAMVFASVIYHYTAPYASTFLTNYPMLQACAGKVVQRELFKNCQMVILPFLGRSVQRDGI